MPDEAHIWTDERIAELEGRLCRMYAHATEDMLAKQSAFMASYESERKRLDRMVGEGRVTKDQRNRILADHAMKSQWYSQMTQTLAVESLNADMMAMDAVNDSIPRVYAENHNFMTYQAEAGLGVSLGFDLVDADTVRRMAMHDPDLVPQWRVDQAKDYVWNRQKFNSAITQGILQGESVDDVAKRVENVIGMNARNARMNARTALTAAENAGRMQSLLRMREGGVDVRKQWVATLDHRTRDTHRAEDKAVRELEERFPNTGLMYPGDMSTNDPGEVYNCRCTMMASFDEVSSSVAYSRRRSKTGTSYAKWRRGRR